MHLAAPAKLNLFLHVTGRRGQFHTLDSLAVFTEFGDSIKIEPAPALTLAVTGPFADALQDKQNNLVLKAARLLQAHSGCRQGAAIMLHKLIPVGGGLGGGSANAAAALRGLQKLWNFFMEEKALQALALELGSDVPVCLQSHAAWMSGVGEAIVPMELPEPLWLLLVNPGIPLSTAEVFQHFTGPFDTPSERPKFSSVNHLIGFLQAKHNVLQPPAMALVPQIRDVLAALEEQEGCLLARMSGSGATCFGIFETQSAAKLAEAKLAQHSGWWCKATEAYGRQAQ